MTQLKILFLGTLDTPTLTISAAFLVWSASSVLANPLAGHLCDHVLKSRESPDLPASTRSP